MKSTPESILINTGSQEESKIQGIIDDFFKEIIKEWTAKNISRETKDLEIKVGDHFYSGNPSDNRTTYLIYEERDVLAAVIETRTGFNKIKYTFFRAI